LLPAGSCTPFIAMVTTALSGNGARGVIVTTVLVLSQPNAVGIGFPADKASLVELTVNGLMASLKVARTRPLTPTPIVPSAGAIEMRVGFARSVDGSVWR